jgi:hypothetical protein
MFHHGAHGDHGEGKLDFWNMLPVPPMYSMVHSSEALIIRNILVFQ